MAGHHQAEGGRKDLDRRGLTPWLIPRGEVHPGRLHPSELIAPRLVPPAGFEPAHPPPEGGALSPELRGRGQKLYRTGRPGPTTLAGCGLQSEDGSAPPDLPDLRRPVRAGPEPEVARSATDDRQYVPPTAAMDDVERLAARAPQRFATRGTACGGSDGTEVRHRAARPVGARATAETCCGTASPCSTTTPSTAVNALGGLSGDRHLPSALLQHDGASGARPSAGCPSTSTTRRAVGAAAPERPVLGRATGSRRCPAGHSTGPGIHFAGGTIAHWPAGADGAGRAADRGHLPGGGGPALGQLHVQLPEPDPRASGHHPRGRSNWSTRSSSRSSTGPGGARCVAKDAKGAVVRSAQRYFEHIGLQFSGSQSVRWVAELQQAPDLPRLRAMGAPAWIAAAERIRGGSAGPGPAEAPRPWVLGPGSPLPSRSAEVQQAPDLPKLRARGCLGLARRCRADPRAGSAGPGPAEAPRRGCLGLARRCRADPRRISRPRACRTSALGPQCPNRSARTATTPARRRRPRPPRAHPWPTPTGRSSTGC